MLKQYTSVQERGGGREGEQSRGAVSVRTVCRFYQRSAARFVPSVAIATVIMHIFRLLS